MNEHPFHVAGGIFAAKAKPAIDLDSLLPSRSASSRQNASPAGSRRRKLWEISHKCHCPVIGSCFAVDELRGLMAKVMHFPKETTDFVLHTTAVGACETRTQLAELLHKQLEKRYARQIREFSAIKDEPALRESWRQALFSGTEIPGALWALLSHPLCELRLEQDVYGDIHMVQHQVGSGNRADLGLLQAMRAENLRLHGRIEEAQRDIHRLRNEKAEQLRSLEQRLIALRTELNGKDTRIASLTGQLAGLQHSLPDMKDRQALARRASDAEARSNALTARLADTEKALEHWRQQAASLADERAVAPEIEEIPGAAADSAASHLGGKCVLCVGGRAGTVDAYRQIVEQKGGRFLHHDGGLEESLHRIDSVLAAADLVICQTGCISHNAYWRVKEQCKRTGKQCLFVKTGGASSFGRIVRSACESEANDP